MLFPFDDVSTLKVHRRSLGAQRTLAVANSSMGEVQHKAHKVVAMEGIRSNNKAMVATVGTNSSSKRTVATVDTNNSKHTVHTRSKAPLVDTHNKDSKDKAARVGTEPARLRSGCFNTHTQRETTEAHT
jgi:hypothetical protein